MGAVEDAARALCAVEERIPRNIYWIPPELTAAVQRLRSALRREEKATRITRPRAAIRTEEMKMEMKMGLLATIEQDVSDDLGLLWSDLGYFGAGLASAIKHDTQKAFDAAVALGTYAKDTFIAVAEPDLDNFWITVKDWAATNLKTILDNFATGGFSAALDAVKSALGAINWRGVATALTGVGEATLATTAHGVVTMALSGLITAAA